MGQPVFFKFLNNAFNETMDISYLLTEYSERHKVFIKTREPQGIDRIDLRELRLSMETVGNRDDVVGKLPLPSPYRMPYNYEMINSCLHNGRRIFFFLMTVKMNVKVFVSDYAFNDWVGDQNWNRRTVHYPTLTQDIKKAHETDDELKTQLNWTYNYYGVPQGPALTWILVFPFSHFYCPKIKDAPLKDSSHIALPYDWLGLNVDSENENVNSNKFITKVIPNTLVPFYESYYNANCSYFLPMLLK